MSTISLMVRSSELARAGTVSLSHRAEIAPWPGKKDLVASASSSARFVVTAERTHQIVDLALAFRQFGPTLIGSGKGFFARLGLGLLDCPSSASICKVG